MGNLTSISNALAFYKIPYEFVNHTDLTFERNFDGYILPGVGSFKHAMDIINSSGLGEFIISEADNGKFILGICLGMQLLLESSTEGGESKGLGLIEGRVVKFDNKDLITPHVGWNEVTFPASTNSFLKASVSNHKDYYFDHSYYVDTLKNNIIATSHYGIIFPSIINKNNTYGIQFHPEKSQNNGIEMIYNFYNVCKMSNG